MGSDCSMSTDVSLGRGPVLEMDRGGGYTAPEATDLHPLKQVRR